MEQRGRSVAEMSPAIGSRGLPCAVAPLPCSEAMPVQPPLPRGPRRDSERKRPVRAMTTAAAAHDIAPLCAFYCARLGSLCTAGLSVHPASQPAPRKEPGQSSLSLWTGTGGRPSPPLAACARRHERWMSSHIAPAPPPAGVRAYGLRVARERRAPAPARNFRPLCLGRRSRSHVALSSSLPSLVTHNHSTRYIAPYLDISSTSIH